MPTWSCNPGEIVAKIRLLIYDTDISGDGDTATFTDEEINDFKSLAEGNVMLAASLACGSMAVAMKGFAFKTGDVSIDKSKAVQKLIDMAKQYRELSFAPAEFVDSYLHEIDEYGKDLSQYINDPN